MCPKRPVKTGLSYWPEVPLVVHQKYLDTFHPKFIYLSGNVAERFDRHEKEVYHNKRKTSFAAFAKQMQLLKGFFLSQLIWLNVLLFKCSFICRRHLRVSSGWHYLPIAFD